MNNFEKIKNFNINEFEDFIKRLKTNYCEYKERNNQCFGCCIEDLCGLPLSKTKQWLESEVQDENS